MNKMHTTHVLGIAGTRLSLDGKPFFWQGLSFFNALYNPTFNASEQARISWLRKFKANGVSVLRVWCQWDFSAPRLFIDVAPEHSMYTSEGEIREEPLLRLCALIEAANNLEMVIELTLFSHEKQPNLPIPVQERGARLVAQRLTSYRNVVLQIWNEDSTEVERYYKAIKAADAERIVTNSPGFSNNLGDDAQNKLLDVLTPHTVRREAPRFWEVAPQQIAYLIEKFGKPVIDDEPARNGPVQFSGIEGGTKPEQHIAQIRRVREVGGYHTYHHDMFQYGYGNPLTPPSGIPDPDFSPFHRQVFDFLRDNPTWDMP